MLSILPSRLLMQAFKVQNALWPSGAQVHLLQPPGSKKLSPGVHLKLGSPIFPGIKGGFISIL